MKLSKVLEAIKEELKKPLPEPRVVKVKKERKMAKKAKKVVDEDEDLDETEDEDTEDETDEDDEDEAPKKGKSKKAAKSAKSSKKSKAKDDDGLISIQDLADEAGINAQSARVKLREAELGKPEGGRWKFKPGSKQLKEARKALGL